jgi:hypothetical protein
MTKQRFQSICCKLRKIEIYSSPERTGLDDIHLVEAIKSMLAFGKVKKYEQNLHPMSKEMFYKRNELSRKAIEGKNLISQAEARSYFTSKHAR